MSKKAITSISEETYTFNKSIRPFPEADLEKAKPPILSESEDNSDLFNEVKEELSVDDQIRLHMDIYRKAERMVVINFYTGGGPYKKGVLDAIYRGFNPLNP